MSHFSIDKQANTRNAAQQVKSDDGGQQTNYSKGHLPIKGKEIKFITFQYITNSISPVPFIPFTSNKYHIILTTDYSYLFFREINPPPPKYC